MLCAPALHLLPPPPTLPVPPTPPPRADSTAGRVVAVVGDGLASAVACPAAAATPLVAGVDLASVAGPATVTVARLALSLLSPSTARHAVVHMVTVAGPAGLHIAARADPFAAVDNSVACRVVGPHNLVHIAAACALSSAPLNTTAGAVHLARHLSFPLHPSSSYNTALSSLLQPVHLLPSVVTQPPLHQSLMLHYLPHSLQLT